MDLKKLIAVARGDLPADLLISNAQVVNTFTGEIEECSVAISQGRIAGVGDYTDAKRVIDLKGRYLAPGLIDGHFHLESAYLHVDQYARAVVPRGTLAAITDLHEITNVCGLEGMRYIMGCARRVPLSLFFVMPSCVPATDMETSGAEVGAKDIAKALRWRGVLGLGEVMNFPAVINASDDMMKKLRVASRRVRDGHAPGVVGRDLNAYLCPLIGSDHEATCYEEGLEKLRRGMFLMIREGSSEKNLEELLPLVTDGNYHRCMLVVDDRNAKDILMDGDVDAVVRKAIGLGLDPVRAIQLATINPARYFGLDGLGGVGPGYWANLIVLGDLKAFDIQQVFYRGRLVAEYGKARFDIRMPSALSMEHTVNIRPFSPEDLRLKGGSGDTFPVIEILPGQIVTKWREERVLREDGAVLVDIERDLLKLVVVERHKATGNIGIGLVKGFGLRKGALATSVAHDSHNIVVVEVKDEDIYAAVKELERNQGGLTVVADGRVGGSLPLPIAGLLSPRPLNEVASKIEELEGLAEEIGCRAPSPFSILSFLALPVIPELKLTDRGLVDVVKGRLLG